MAEEHLEGRYQSLDRRVDHIDGRVNAMAEDMSSIKTSMQSIVHSVGQLTDRAANPTPTNWVGIGSLLLALVLAGGGFVALTTEPMQASILHLERKDQANDDLHSARGAIIGTATATIQDNVYEIKQLWLENKALRDKLLKLSNNQAYNAGSMDALEKRVDGIDNYGSRRWTMETPQ